MRTDVVGIAEGEEMGKLLCMAESTGNVVGCEGTEVANGPKQLSRRRGI